jgi:hypothetical protein
MLVHYMEGHLVSAHNLILSSSTDPLIAAPLAYAWPQTGDVGRRSAAGAAGGLSPAAQQALIATLSVAAAAATALLCFLIVTSWRRRLRQRQELAAAALKDASGGGALGGGVGGAGDGFGSHISAAPHGAHAHAHGDARSASANSGSGLAAVCASCQARPSLEAFDIGSGDGDSAASGRWRQLLLAINTRVADIHAKRLAAGLSAGRGQGSGSGASDPSDPLPLLASRGGSGPGLTASNSSRRTAPEPAGAPWELPESAHILASGGPNGTGSYTGTRTASFKSAPSASRGAPRHGQPQQIALLEALGSGTFGTVFRGRWHGAEVAVKLVQLPVTLVGEHGGGGEATAAAAFASARERMAVQEAAISTTMTHPNIVALYCIGLRPVHAGAMMEEGGSEGGSGGGPGGSGDGPRPWDAPGGGFGGAIGEAGSGDTPALVGWELQLSKWPRWPVRADCLHGAPFGVLRTLVFLGWWTSGSAWHPAGAHAVPPACAPGGRAPAGMHQSSSARPRGSTRASRTAPYLALAAPSWAPSPSHPSRQSWSTATRAR